MIYWLLQFADLVYYHIFHIFFAFGALCWFIWILRVVRSAPYKPFTTAGSVNLPVTILIPVYNEKLDVLTESLGSMIKYTSPNDEILALVDVRDEAVREPGALIHHPRLKMLVAPPGKRPALVAGFNAATNPIIVITGSDTQFNKDTIQELTKPFSDPKVGGVTGQVLATTDRGLGAKCYEWALVLRNKMIYPAMSRSSAVHVLNGECFAMRRELAVLYQEEFLNQKFLGRLCDSGDDGWITTLLVKYEFKTVYQSTAIAYTVPPISFGAFLRQQLRWNRNSTRRCLMVLTQGWAYQRGFMYPFQHYIALLKLPFWIIVIVLAAIRFLIGHDVGVVAASWLDPAWHIYRPAIFLAGVIIIRALRGIPYLVDQPKALFFLPSYAFISPFILAPYKLYAMLTARDTRWLTRGEGKTKRGLAAYTTSIAAILLVVFSFPLVALVAAVADDESDSY